VASARTIINTRPDPDSATLRAALGSAGISSVESPCLDIRLFGASPDWIAENARSVRASLAQAGGFAFTSANGVRALKALPVGIDRIVPCFCVGSATAREAGRAGFDQIIKSGGDVERLAETILKSGDLLSGRPVVHVTGTVRRGDLQQRLEAGGLLCARLVLYAAEPVPTLSPAAADLLRTHPDLAGVVLFSPRTARLFIDQLVQAGLTDRIGLMACFAASPAIAEAARVAALGPLGAPVSGSASRSNWGSVHVAPEADLAAITGLVKKWVTSPFPP